MRGLEGVSLWEIKIQHCPLFCFAYCNAQGFERMEIYIENEFADLICLGKI